MLLIAESSINLDLLINSLTPYVVDTPIAAATIIAAITIPAIAAPPIIALNSPLVKDPIQTLEELIL